MYANLHVNYYKTAVCSQTSPSYKCFTLISNILFHSVGGSKQGFSMRDGPRKFDNENEALRWKLKVSENQLEYFLLLNVT